VVFGEVVNSLTIRTDFMSERMLCYQSLVEARGLYTESYKQSHVS